MREMVAVTLAGAALARQQPDETLRLLHRARRQLEWQRASAARTARIRHAIHKLARAIVVPSTRVKVGSSWEFIGEDRDLIARLEPAPMRSPAHALLPIRVELHRPELVDVDELHLRSRHCKVMTELVRVVLPA